MARPRIIGGSAKGRALETPKRGTRPSPARLREALFNILEFRERGSFLDLYSGSGAIGLEAASRGWQSTCVDFSHEAVTVIRQNARALELPVEAVRGDALTYAKAHPASFAIVFAAPPYPLELIRIFQSILDAEVATPGGLYIFQHPSKLELDLTLNAPHERDTRAYGSNAVTFIQPTAQP